MRENIIHFFKLPKLKNLKEITTNQLLFVLSSEKIATNSADAYYFIRICKGMGVLKQKAPKIFNIDRSILHEEEQALKKERGET